MTISSVSNFTRSAQVGVPHQKCLCSDQNAAGIGRTVFKITLSALFGNIEESTEVLK